MIPWVNTELLSTISVDTQEQWALIPGQTHSTGLTRRSIRHRNASCTSWPKRKRRHAVHSPETPTAQSMFRKTNDRQEYTAGVGKTDICDRISTATRAQAGSRASHHSSVYGQRTNRIIAHQIQGQNKYGRIQQHMRRSTDVTRQTDRYTLNMKLKESGHLLLLSVGQA